MKMKSKFMCFGLVLTLVLSFVGCGFNEDKAKADSNQALQSFFNSHKNNEALVSDKDMKKVKDYVSKNFKDYFTSDFMTDTCNQIETGFSTNPLMFYITDNFPKNKVVFKNNYLIGSSTVDKDNKTVTYKITDKLDSNLFYQVQMKQEDDKWKINKVE